MPEAVAAREAARRSRNGVRRAATHAARAPRRWRARSLASAVLAGACATG
ncbi:TraB/GumN family protein, partial [Burkholderia pseudomallei]